MPVGDIRFLHASDFHLDRPLGGVAEVAAHLREPFIEAPYRAARRVFDAALAEEVDFVVLSGGLLDPAATGPRGVLFLHEQFERLAQRNIAVYWAGGKDDGADDWPREIPLPDNVHHFSTGKVTEFLHRRGGEVVARLVGQSRGRRNQVPATDYCVNGAHRLTIAVHHGAVEIDDQPLDGAPDYWALGGQPDWQQRELAGAAAHVAGSPQGRNPAEPGPHGCTLVSLAADGTKHSRPIATDVLRWLTMRLRLEQHATQEAFERLLRDASKALLGKEAGADLLVTWSIAGEGPLWEELHRGELASQWLSMLRGEFGFGSPALWSIAINTIAPPLESGSALEDDSLLADYLRTLRAGAQSADEIDLRPYLAEWTKEPWPDELTRIAGPERDEIVRKAALLGRELLRGEVLSS
jgi:hypothetical protein